MAKVIAVAHLKVYPTAAGIKTAPRGKTLAAGQVFGMLSKGEARKLRKSLRQAGFSAHASAKRLVK